MPAFHHPERGKSRSTRARRLNPRAARRAGRDREVARAAGLPWLAMQRVCRGLHSAHVPAGERGRWLRRRSRRGSATSTSRASRSRVASRATSRAESTRRAARGAARRELRGARRAARAAQREAAQRDSRGRPPTPADSEIAARQRNRDEQFEAARARRAVRTARVARAGRVLVARRVKGSIL